MDTLNENDGINKNEGIDAERSRRKISKTKLEKEILHLGKQIKWCETSKRQ